MFGTFERWLMVSSFRGFIELACYKMIQGGIPTSCKWSDNSIYRGYNPSYSCVRPFLADITLYL